MTRSRPVRLAHLIDLHLWPDGGQAAQQTARALEHAQASGAELLLMGGDLVMDALTRTAREVEAQWAVVQAVLRKHVRVPVHHAHAARELMADPEKSASTACHGWFIRAEWKGWGTAGPMCHQAVIGSNPISGSDQARSRQA